MSRSPLLFGLVLVAATTLVVWTLARELSRGWFLPGAQAQVVEELEQSLADQRELAQLAPQTSDERRQRFERTQALLRHLRVLALSREGLAQRHASLLLAGALAVAVSAGGVHALRQARRDRRLAQLQERDRRRLASLEDLSRWQEAARRHAHEMRTPLAAAQLDLQRLRDSVAGLPESEPRAALAELLEELDADVRRLREFAQAFAAFGRLPQPRLVACDLGQFVGEFVERFRGAWPNLELQAHLPEAACPALLDGDLLRQVLVNLGDNSAGALREAERGRGLLRLGVAAADGGWTVLVSDDGPGLRPEARARIFQPYSSFRPGGTGLGLAISRKVLLDHGGDLELCSSGAQGTTFRLFLPAVSREAAA